MSVGYKYFKDPEGRYQEQLWQFKNWHKIGWIPIILVLLYIRSWDSTVTEVKVRVETYDGCVTFWYEKSRVKNPTEVVCNRVTNQLMGLNIKEVSVTVA